MMLGGCHEPGAGFIGNARLGPLLERGDERTLRKIFCKTYITDEAREGRDQSGGFDPPDCINGAMDIRGGHGKVCLNRRPRRRLAAESENSVATNLPTKDFVDFACAVASNLPEAPREFNRFFL